MSSLNGKVAVVTGSSRGLGAAIAKDLASKGAKVVVNYSSSSERAQQVVESIKADGGAAVAVGADMGSVEPKEAGYRSRQCVW